MEEKEVIYRTSKDWYDEIQGKEGVTIINPSGWDQTNFTRSFYEELIPEEEFKARLEISEIKIIKEKIRS